MVAHAVLSVVGIATLGTDVPGNMLMHKYHMFQDRSFFSFRWTLVTQLTGKTNIVLVT